MAIEAAAVIEAVQSLKLNGKMQLLLVGGEPVSKNTPKNMEPTKMKVCKIIFFFKQMMFRFHLGFFGVSCF